jgi:hypothetical protein
MVRALASPYDISRKSLQNFYKFMNSLDKVYYQRDINLRVFMLTIDLLITARFDNDRELDSIMNRVQVEIGSTYLEICEALIYPNLLSVDDVQEKDVRFIEKTIETYLKFGMIIDKKDDLSDIITDISSGNVKNLQESLSTFRGIVNELSDEFKKSDSSEGKFNFVHLASDEFLDQLRETYDYFSSPKIVLKTGLKRFNEMFSNLGGVIGGKVYAIYATTNTFKSALLLHIARWFQLYNSALFMEDYLRDGKKPTILFVSLENGNKEDDSRFYSAFTKSQITNQDNFDGAAKMWKESFNATGSCIDITVLHLEDNVFGVDELKNAVQLLEDDNYRVIAVLIDSLDLMASNKEDNHAEERIKLSGISKSLKKYVKDRPFPILFSMQLNREADRAITDKKSGGMTNIAKFLSRSFVAGSADIERRVDFSCFIYLEVSPFNGKLYLEVKREKMRYLKTEVDYFCHELINGFFIDDDIYKEGYGSLLDITPSDNDLFINSNTVGSRGVTTLKPRKADETKVIEIKVDKDTTTLDDAILRWVYSEGLSRPKGYAHDNYEGNVEVGPYTEYDEYGWPV